MERAENGAGKEQSSCIVLKLRWAKFKLECCNFRILRVISLVTTKKLVIEHTQRKMRKEFQHFTTQNPLNTKQCSNAGNEGQKSYKASIDTNNKWQKLSTSWPAITLNVNEFKVITRQKLAEWIKTQDPTLRYLQETHRRSKDINRRYSTQIGTQREQGWLY